MAVELGVPVQKFRPTSGGGLAMVSFALIGASLLGVAVYERSSFGVQAVAILLWAAVLVYVALIRPRATAYRDVLVLTNLVSDWHVPMVAIEDVIVRQQLYVWVGQERYGCVGIGRPTKSLVRNKRNRGGALSVLGMTEHTASGTAGDPRLEAGDYQTFVERRIEELAEEARRDRPRNHSGVHRVWDVVVLAGLIGGGIAMMAIQLLL